LNQLPLPVERPATRIFVVAAVRLYRDSLVDTLAREGLTVVGAHAGGGGIAPLLEAAQPDVVLLDMAIADSYGVARLVQQTLPAASIVALGPGVSDKELLTYAEAGIAGLVAADALVPDLVAGVERAARGELVCSPSVMRDLVHRVAKLSAAPTQAVRLTDRERSVVDLLRQDLSNQEIATTLGIGVSTVKHHVHNVLQRLGVRRRREAVVVLQRAQRGVPTLRPKVRAR
jgi:two-component system, NarL family, nitrate/nitrite response regulator NarL